MKRIVGILTMLTILGLVDFLVPLTARAAGSPPDLKALMAMSLQQLRERAAAEQINLGDATSHDTVAGLIYEAETTRYVAAPSGSQAPTDPAKQPEPTLKLPDAEWFQPRVPDLSKQTVAGRGWSIGLILIGLAAVVVLLAAVVRAIYLAYQIVTGKLSLAQIGMQLGILAIGVGLIISVFGASIYRVISGFYEFLKVASQ